MKERLENAQAVFDFSEGLIKRCKDRDYDLKIDPEDRASGVTHPVFRVHPLTGKTSIFVNWTHTDRIEGLDDAESRELLSQLYAHCERPEYVYSHQYSPNDLIVWDNASTIHTGDGTTQVERPRVMRRVVVAF